MSAVTDNGRIRTAMMRMLAGAIFGAVAMSLFLFFIPKASWDIDDPSIMIATVAGASYLLIGLSVAIGLVAPNTGARFLNVEDSDELREERPKLKSATLVFFLTGAFLLVLAFSKAGAGFLSPGAAAVVAVACLAGILIAGWISSKRSDELTMQMGQEASSISFQLAMLGVGGWAIFAALGKVATIEPLTLLSSLALLQLFVTFVVIGRRGMLIR